jgi:hypothetical protein
VKDLEKSPHFKDRTYAAAVWRKELMLTRVDFVLELVQFDITPNLGNQVDQATASSNPQKIPCQSGAPYRSSTNLSNRADSRSAGQVEFHYFKLPELQKIAPKLPCLALHPSHLSRRRCICMLIKFASCLWNLCQKRRIRKHYLRTYALFFRFLP